VKREPLNRERTADSDHHACLSYLCQMETDRHQAAPVQGRIPRGSTAIRQECLRHSLQQPCLAGKSCYYRRVCLESPRRLPRQRDRTIRG
jgi:hypothetical protein